MFKVNNKDTGATSSSFSIDDNRKIMRSFYSNAQETFTCSKSTMETIEKGVKCVPKLIIEASEQCHEVLVSIVNFEYMSHLFLLLLLLTLSMYLLGKTYSHDTMQRRIDDLIKHL